METVYHRTVSTKIAGISKEGLKKSSGYYGNGVYNFLELKAVTEIDGVHGYGDAIVASKVDIYGFLIDDAKIAKTVYGDESLQSQLHKFIPSMSAYDVAHTFGIDRGNKLESLVSGIIILTKGSHWVVVFDESKLKPFQWSEHKKIGDPLNWQNLNVQNQPVQQNKPVVQKPIFQKQVQQTNDDDDFELKLDH